MDIMSARKIQVGALAASDAPVTMGSREWVALTGEYQDTVRQESDALFRRSRVFHVLAGKGAVIDADGAAVKTKDVAASFGLAESTIRQGRSFFGALQTMRFSEMYGTTVPDAIVAAHDTVRDGLRRVGGQRVKWADGTVTGAPNGTTTRAYIVDTVGALDVDDETRASALADMVAAAVAGIIAPEDDPVESFLSAVESFVETAEAFHADHPDALNNAQRKHTASMLATVAALITSRETVKA